MWVYVKETQGLMRYISLETHGNSDILSYDYLDNEDLKKNIDGGVVVYEHDV